MIKTKHNKQFVTQTIHMEIPQMQQVISWCTNAPATCMCRRLFPRRTNKHESSLLYVISRAMRVSTKWTLCPSVCHKPDFVIRWCQTARSVSRFRSRATNPSVLAATASSCSVVAAASAATAVLASVRDPSSPPSATSGCTRSTHDGDTDLLSASTLRSMHTRSLCTHTQHGDGTTQYAHALTP